MNDMSLLFLVLIFTFLGSVASLVGGFFLIWKEKLTKKFIPLFIPFAAGTLLSTSFFDILPEALSLNKNAESILLFTLLGIISFFFIERYLLWHHHHHQENENCKNHPTNILLMTSDTIHNFLDGIIITASFIVSIPLGIVTAIAVFMHEVPQEISDFGVLLSNKMSKKNVVLINVLSSLSSFLGVFLSFYFFKKLENLLPFFLSFAAGNFIYIASSDLIPEIHRKFKSKKANLQTLSFLAGILITFLLTLILE